MTESDINSLLKKMNFNDKNSLINSLLNSLNDSQRELVEDAVNNKETAEKLLSTPEAKIIYDILNRKGSL